MSATNSNGTQSWTQLKAWSDTVGLPVLPPPAAVLELLGLVAVIIAIDLTFPSLGFTSLEPSPFWLPVLLLSLQYGTVAGLLAAAAATAVYVFNGVAEQAVGENYFEYLLRIWALPILWIGVALVLGQFRLRQISQKLVLRQTSMKRTAEAQNLAAYARDLEVRCQKLERQLTTRTAASAKPMLDTLATLVGHDIAPHAITEIMAKTIWPDSQASLFSTTGTGCGLVEHAGWPDAAAWSTDISSAHPLYKAIVVERRAVSLLIPGDEAILAGQGLAAYPILAADGRAVVGMLKIEAMDAEAFDDATTTHLAVLAQLIGGGPDIDRGSLAQPSAHIVRSSRAWATLRHSPSSISDGMDRDATSPLTTPNRKR